MGSIPLISAGINLAFAFMSLFIAYKKIDWRIYITFGLFSLFSAFYFISPILSLLWQFVIFGVAVYYAAFSWFVNSFVEKHENKLPVAFSIIYALAFLCFIIPGFRFYGQLLAHIGLLGLVVQLVFASISLKNSGRTSYLDFSVLTVFFTILTVEEILHLQFKTPLFGQYFRDYLPLDLFPILFTFIIGKRLASDLVFKTQFNIQKEKLTRKEVEIGFKKQDMTDFGIEISRTRKFIIHLSNLTSELSNSKNDDVIKSLKSEINAFLSNGKSADVLNNNVQEVNHEFALKLKNKFPSLSKNEIQICMLLRLQLSTKEIASLKNISQDSMKVVRYRIRKKMALDSAVNLADYIQAL